MKNIIDRPKPPEKKIRSSEDFELCYLRHQYFRRVKYNPTEEEMSPYMKIVEHLSKNTFFTYMNLFRAVGLYHDDVINIGRVHLVSFLGLYSLDKMPEKKTVFSENFSFKNFKDPTDKDFDNKNKANFTMFFKQRMEDLVRVCRQKSRNIKGKSSEEYLVFSSPNKPPKYIKRVLEDHEALGYKKVDFAIFKSIRKKANVNHDATVFQFDNLWYIAIPIEQNLLSIDDLIGSTANPYENEHNVNPEDLLLEKESNTFSIKFNTKSNYRKRVTLRKFIAKHKNKGYYKDEVLAAKKMLKTLEA